MAELLAEGYTVTEIARRLHVSKPTVCHHARRLGHSPSPKYNRRYNWSEVQRYYDAGHTVRECREHFGLANQTWNDAVKRGDVVARSRGTPLNDLLVPIVWRRSRYSLKRRLFGTGLKNSRCEECGLTSGAGSRLARVSPPNGKANDSRLENLAILCPNCHSLTENFAGRYRKRAA